MTAELISISQALLTPVIAIATTYIAYQQYRIRRDERSLALYDRRLAIYKLTIGIVDRIRAGNVITVEEVHTWLNSIAEVDFLFGEEISAVTEELFGALDEYAFETEPIALGGKKAYNTECAEAALNVEGFRVPLHAVFAPYLRPAGSPLKRKRRLSVAEAKQLVSDATTDIKAKQISERELDVPENDIPF